MHPIGKEVWPSRKRFLEWRPAAALLPAMYTADEHLPFKHAITSSYILLPTEMLIDILYSRAIHIIVPKLIITKPNLDVSFLVATNNKASQRLPDNPELWQPTSSSPVLDGVVESKKAQGALGYKFAASVG